jgi:hypothetical protein
LSCTSAEEIIYISPKVLKIVLATLTTTETAETTAEGI